MNTTDLASSSNTPFYKLPFDNLPLEVNYNILHQTLYFYSHPNRYPDSAIEPINTLLSARKVSQNLKDTIDYYPYGAGMLFQAIGQLHNIYLRTNQTNDIEHHSKDSFEISNYRYIPDFLDAVIKKLSMDNDNWKDLLAHSLNRIYREDYDSRDIIKIVFNRMYIQYVSDKIAYSSLPSFQYGLLHWGARFFKNQFSSHKFLSLCLEQSQDLMILDENQYTPLHAAIMSRNLDFIDLLLSLIEENKLLKKSLISIDRYGNTPLHLVLAMPEEYLNKILEYIVDNEPLFQELITIENTHKRTPIHTSLNQGKLTLIKAVCENVSDKDFISQLIDSVKKMSINTETITTKTEALTLLAKHFRLLQ